MSPAGGEGSEAFRLRLPATSANLGAGFDAAAVALGFYLHLEAKPRAEFSVVATGRDAERCGSSNDNLILETYRRILEQNQRPVVPLRIKMSNEIPLGMGCGSSAAGRLAAIALAVHFGQLGWTDSRIIEEASGLEGHPDNAAACWLGGYVSTATEGRRVHIARVVPPAEWRALLVLPSEPLATSKARAVLPSSYSRDDVIHNLQSVSLLGLAFAQGRGDLLRVAMSDRIHQPFRAAICPMLQPLLPLAGSDGIIGVALSGAGPAVLLVIETESVVDAASESVRRALAGSPEPELTVCAFEPTGAGRKAPEPGF